MNLYFLVEGQRTEKKIYRSWLAHVLPNMKFVGCPEDVTDDCIRLMVGGGYPQYLSRIGEILGEIATLTENQVDHFFVCSDAEEQSYKERHDEISERIKQGAPVIPWSVIVQDCCIETWFLGNRRFLKRNPQSATLRDFKRFYDVSERDPEAMKLKPPYRRRSLFHLNYLKDMFRERRLSYTKKNPGPAAEPAYLEALIQRHEQTQHIRSFGHLVAILRTLGAAV